MKRYTLCNTYTKQTIKRHCMLESIRFCSKAIHYLDKAMLHLTAIFNSMLYSHDQSDR